MTSAFFRYLVILISSIFILAGAVNVGSAGQFFVIPFWITLAFSIRNFPPPKKIIILLSISMLYLPLKLNQETNSFIFPIIGKKIEIIGSWHYVVFTDSKDKQYLTPPSDNNFSWKSYHSYGKVITPSTLEIIGVSTSHGDFGTQFKAILKSNKGATYRMYIDSIRSEIEGGTIISPDLANQDMYEVQSEWSHKFSMLAAWPLLIVLGIARL